MGMRNSVNLDSRKSSQCVLLAGILPTNDTLLKENKEIKKNYLNITRKLVQFTLNRNTSLSFPWNFDLYSHGVCCILVTI